MSKKENIRYLALESLLMIDREGRKSNEVTDAVLTKYAYLPKTDRAFYTRLVRGTLENRIRSDLILNTYSKTPVKKMKPVIREILRMAVYQIEKMDSVPERVAVDEAVKLAVKKGFGNLKGFVNGVLRSFIREPERFRTPSKDEPSLYLQAEYSVPVYLTDTWVRRFGPETAEKICRAFQKEGGITVRIRRNRDEVLEAWEQAGIRLEPAPYMDEWFENNKDTDGGAFRLYGADTLTELEAFRGGDIFVQDVSSMMAVCAAGIRKGQRILDVCAAPGGKSLFAADLTGETGRVLSRDISDAKTALIEENIRRCGLSNIEAEVHDGCIYDESLAGAMDVVIVDAPCSGYGVIGRKCDIVFSASAEKETSLSELQKKILENAARYVKKGGVLIYSTCTISEAENEKNAEWFLKRFAELGFRADGLKGFLPEKVLSDHIRSDDENPNFIQLIPGVHDCDGFFIARFKRNA